MAQLLTDHVRRQPPNSRGHPKDGGDALQDKPPKQLFLRLKAVSHHSSAAQYPGRHGIHTGLSRGSCRLRTREALPSSRCDRRNGKDGLRRRWSRTLPRRHPNVHGAAQLRCLWRLHAWCSHYRNVQYGSHIYIPFDVRDSERNNVVIAACEPNKEATAPLT